MANRLQHETSPYLLQHADNPVDWYPWGEEALEAARTQDKPILLSIGYAACHWCHVMERESFENPDIAALMNQHFINIKVDREERPDLDTVYMAAAQMMTGQGGWPLTIFLMPDGKPFYAGTYFPPEDRSGMPGFPRVLLAVAEAYRNRRDDLERAANDIQGHLTEHFRWSLPETAITPALLNEAASGLALQFDEALALQRRHPNVWLETSSQSLANVRRLVAEGDPNRIVHGSDWPFYHPAISVAKVLIATEGRPDVRHRILWANGARLLGIE